MTSLKEGGDVTDCEDRRKDKDSELPPSGTSLHKRRRGEPPASLSVKGNTSSDLEGSSPCTAGPTSEEYWSHDGEMIDAEGLCDNMLQRLKNRDDPVSKRGKEVASKTKETIEILDQLEKLLELLDQFVNLKVQHGKLLKRLRDVNHLKRLHNAHKRIDKENDQLRLESKEIELINEALDAEMESEYGTAIFDSMMSGGRSVKRTGSKWMRSGHGRFGGSLLRKQRSRSAGGDDSDAPPGTPLRRRSEGIFCKEVEKSKVSKWTRVKAAFRWEKAQWPPTSGAAGAVAAGALVGVVALAGSSPGPGLSGSPGPGSSAPGVAFTPAPTVSDSSPVPGYSRFTTGLGHPEPRDSASLTPGSALSLTPNSSCEELRMDSVSTVIFTSCQSPKVQTTRKVKQSTPQTGTQTLQKPQWLNDSLLQSKTRLKHTPEWPESILKQQKTRIMKSLKSQTQPVKRMKPDWPEKMYQRDLETPQEHKPWQPKQKHNISLKEKLSIPKWPQEPYRSLGQQSPDLPPKEAKRPDKGPREPHLLKFQDNMKIGKSVKDIIQATVAKAEIGIVAEPDSPERKRTFDATDADFVNFLMVQADDMVDAMASLFTTRRIPHYFTVHHTRCYGARTYCTEACREVLQNICRKFKCSRQVKEYVTNQCAKCNLKFIREFPRNLLLNLDFLKAREVYSKVSNRTFESFFPPKYLKPFYSKNQPSPNRTADLSYYSSNSSEYYYYYYVTEEVIPANYKYPPSSTTTTTTKK